LFSRICVCCNSLRVTDRKVYNIINFVILMKRKNEIKLFDRRLNKLAGKILVFAGENPLVFLDTGAIIDFEREIDRWKLAGLKISPVEFYKELFKRIGRTPVYVTEHIYNESMVHNQHHVINGKREISDGTIDFISGLHSDYCSFLRDVQNNPYFYDNLRYHTYWAGKMAFDKYHKKNCLDPMSFADRELVSSALWARYASFLKGGNEVDVTSSVIISPDCHVSEVSKVLVQNFGYDGLEVVSSR